MQEVTTLGLQLYRQTMAQWLSFFRWFLEFPVWSSPHLSSVGPPYGGLVSNTIYPLTPTHYQLPSSAGKSKGSQEEAHLT